MDEIDWIKNSKKAIKVMIKVILILAFILILLGTISMLINGIDEYGVLTLIVFAGIGIGMSLFLVLMYGILYVIYKIVYGGQKKVIFEKEYIREISEEYTPAIASLVYDLKIDVYKDYTATILHLYSKGYINIFENNKVCKIEISNDKDLSVLQEHEKYVIECLNNKQKFNEKLFKEILIKNAQSKNLLTNQKESKNSRIGILIVIAFISIAISYFINIILFSFVLTVVFVLVYLYVMMSKMYKNEIKELVVDTLYKRTKEGEKVARELTALKRFIHEYTLLKGRSIEHVQVLDEYIPYAISLDEAESIEEYIKSNEAYRNLIYNREKKG